MIGDLSTIDRASSVIAPVEAPRSPNGSMSDTPLAQVRVLSTWARALR